MRNRGKISDFQRYQLGLVVVGGRQRCGREVSVVINGQPKAIYGVQHLDYDGGYMDPHR